MAGRGESYKSAISYKKWVIPIYWVMLKWHERHVLLLNKIPKPLLPAFSHKQKLFSDIFLQLLWVNQSFNNLFLICRWARWSCVICGGGAEEELKITRSFFLPSWDLHLLTPSQRFCFFLSMKPESLKDSCCSKISSFISAERRLKVLQKKSAFG